MAHPLRGARRGGSPPVGVMLLPFPKDVRKAARAPKLHRSNIVKAFAREQIPVRARPPRQKPVRDSDVLVERVKWCLEVRKRRGGSKTGSGRANV